MKRNLIKILIFSGIVFISYEIVEFNIIFGIIVFILSAILFIALISDIEKYSVKNVIFEILIFSVIVFISYKIVEFNIIFGIIVFIISSLIFAWIAIDINEKNYKNKKNEKEKKYKQYELIDKLKKKEKEIEKREKELEEKERETLNKAAEVEAMKEKLKEKEKRIEEMLEKIRMEEEEETKKDKIAVTTAINIGIRLVEKFLNKLKELNEKYSEGTHLHFAVTLYEFREVEEELKNNYNIVKNSIEEFGYPFTIWQEEIDKYINLYSENMEYYAYDKAYKYCLLALAYCYSYALMINTINILRGESEESKSEETKTEYKEESFYTDIPKEFQNEDGTLANYYQILWENEYIESEYEKYVTYTRKDIDKQYKEMAKKYHPDKHTDDKEYAEAKFKEIQNAKDMLFERRNEYDEIYLEYFRKKYS